jgi:hypothetical protein
MVLRHAQQRATPQPLLTIHDERGSGMPAPPLTVQQEVTSVAARPLIVLIATVVLAAAAGSASAAGPGNGALPRGVKPCGVVHGASWTAGARHGSSWKVEVKQGESCALARQWVPRLTRDLHRPLAGPNGYTCTRPPTATRARGGTCTGANGTFYWHIPPLRD